MRPRSLLKAHWFRRNGCRKKSWSAAGEAARPDHDHEPADRHHDSIQQQPEEAGFSGENPLDVSALRKNEVDAVRGGIRADIKTEKNPDDAVNPVLAGHERVEVLPGQIARRWHE